MTKLATPTPAADLHTPWCQRRNHSVTATQLRDGAELDACLSRLVTVGGLSGFLNGRTGAEPTVVLLGSSTGNEMTLAQLERLHRGLARLAERTAASARVPAARPGGGR